jgi:molecular chaperone DnaK
MQIGIDLGTTNTVVAYFKNERIEYLKFKRDETLSSVILYKDGKVTVGEKAKKKAVSNPKNFIKSSKAYMGDSSKSWEIEDRVFSPTEVATEILKEIRNSFKDVSEIEAVITVPAYFKSNQIDETKKAGEKAGFKVKQIITEPVAAAVAYGFEDEVNQKLFIVDIGGGTFDVSLLEVSNRTFNTLSVDGDRRLGGDDFDEHVLEFLLKYVRKEHGVNLASFEKSGIGEDDYFKAKQALISKAEDVKKELSEAENVEVEIPNLLSGYNLKTSISRDKFEEISEETISKIERIIQKSKSDVDKVVLVGGTSRIPAVREFVTKLFGKSPYSDKPLDKLVAMGAAIVAHDEDTVQIRDIISHSLGVELVDEKFSPILKKGENYPISTTQTYTTSMDFQKSVDVNVFEGEDEDDVNMNDFYGGFSLENIEQAKAGTPQIEVTFEFDKSRILKVTAKDVGSGSSRSEEIEIDKGSKKKITPDKLKAQVMFVLDTTGSMWNSIQAVKQAIIKVVNVYSKSMIEISFGITEFRDRVYHANGGDSGLLILQVHKFAQSSFTTNTTAFENIVSNMSADGGGPAPESSYDGIYSSISKADWKENHLRVVVHITDAQPNIPDLEISNISDLANKVDGKFDQIFHLMPSYVSSSYYTELANCKAYSSTNKASQFFEELNDDTENIVQALIKIAEVSSSSLQAL